MNESQDGVPLIEYENKREQIKWLDYFEKLEELFDEQERGYFSSELNTIKSLIKRKFPSELTKAEYEAAVRQGVFDEKMWEDREQRAKG